MKKENFKYLIIFCIIYFLVLVLYCNIKANTMDSSKSYRAIRHDVIRDKQSKNLSQVHHPDDKINQLKFYLPKDDYEILECFAGHGNLSSFYIQLGNLTAIEYKKKVFNKLQERLNQIEIKNEINLIRSDSFHYIHKLIYDKKIFNIIDLDAYGFPNRFFPHIFLLINDGYLVITMPKPSVNILNGITQVHLSSYYGTHNPTFKQIIEKIAIYGLCHWKKVTLVDALQVNRVYRVLLKVESVKATDYTGTKNR